jgi:hypothetical protein
MAIGAAPKDHYERGALSVEYGRGSMMLPSFINLLLRDATQYSA